MNNSYFSIEQATLKEEPELEREAQLKDREGELVRIVSAIRRVRESEDWSTLKSTLFDGLTSRLTRELLAESKKENPDTLRLNRLTGQLVWAERYSSLEKLEATYFEELNNLRKNHGTTEKPPARGAFV